MVSPVEMDTMAQEVPAWRGVTPLTLNLSGADGTSELRKRNNHATEEESVWTLKVRASVFLISLPLLNGPFALAA